MYLKILDLVESAWEVMVFEAGIPLRIGYIGFSKDQLVVHAKTQHQTRNVKLFNQKVPAE